MILPAILLLLASGARVPVADDLVEVPPAEWRYFEVALKQPPVTLLCRFDAQGAARGLRLALLRGEDVGRFKEDRPYGVLAATSAGAHGSLQFRVDTPGRYAILLDNREDSRHPAKVRLRVDLDFSAPAVAPVRYLSPARRLTVIAISFAFFSGIVFYAGRKFLRGTRL